MRPSFVVIDRASDASTSPRDEVIDEARAWSLLLALARRASLGAPIVESCGVGIGDDGEIEVGGRTTGVLQLDPMATPTFRTPVRATPAAIEMLDLYLPLCLGAKSATLVVGHLGQSLDGQIATSTGASHYVSGREDLVHTHRLRALCDAVLVGATTADLDDPQLTTRLAEGPNPARVVIDPKRRVPVDRRLFKDGAAPTIVVPARPSDDPTGAARHGSVTAASPNAAPSADAVDVAPAGERVAPTDIVDELARRGLRRLLVEGGGVTLSHFLAAGAIDRLHLTVCPVLMGRGRPGIVLPAVDRLSDAIRPRVRRFVLGNDVLFDCEMRG